MPRDAFVLKMQRELCHSKYTQKFRDFLETGSCSEHSEYFRMSSSHHRNSTFPTSLLLFSIRTINHNSTGLTLLKVDYFFFVSFPDQISNENCVRPLTIFQSVSTFRVIELKPAALDCQSEMSSFLSKPLRYLFITQLKQNRSLQAKTVFPKIPTDYVDPFMGEGRGVLA